MSSVSVDPCYIPLETEAIEAPSGIAPLSRTPEKLALVIPTFREAESLRGLLSEVRAALALAEIPFEIIVVDDDSQDGTEELVTAFALQDPRVRLFVRRGERGLSGAVLHGWQQTDAAILGVMDADMQHPPALLPKLIAEILNGSDLAIGSRYTSGGRVGEWNPIRKLISALAVWVTYPIQRPFLRAMDPMSGFFLVRRSCVHRIGFEPRGFKLLLEILVRGHVSSVCEVPFSFGRRSAGSSKASLKVAWEYLLLLVKLYGFRWSSPEVIEEAAGD